MYIVRLFVLCGGVNYNKMKYLNVRWKVQGTKFGNPEIIDGSYNQIAEIPDMTEEAVANAKLIAAAPQMLEALQNLENDANQMPDTAWQLVKDAINSAVGNED